MLSKNIIKKNKNIREIPYNFKNIKIQKKYYLYYKKRVKFYLVYAFSFYYIRYFKQYVYDIFIIKLFKKQKNILLRDILHTLLPPLAYLLMLI